MSYDDKIQRLYKAIRAEKTALEKEIDRLRGMEQTIVVEPDPEQATHIDKLRARVDQLEVENHQLKQERDDLARRLERLRGLL